MHLWKDASLADYSAPSVVSCPASSHNKHTGEASIHPHWLQLELPTRAPQEHHAVVLPPTVPAPAEPADQHLDPPNKTHACDFPRNQLLYLCAPETKWQADNLTLVKRTLSNDFSSSHPELTSAAQLQTSFIWHPGPSNMSPEASVLGQARASFPCCQQSKVFYSQPSSGSFLSPRSQQGLFPENM